MSKKSHAKKVERERRRLAMKNRPPCPRPEPREEPRFEFSDHPAAEAPSFRIKTFATAEEMVADLFAES